MNKNSFSYIVALIVALCLVCSALVSIAAIGLREQQLANIELEKNANLLASAGMLDMSESNAKSRVPSLMTNIETVVVDFATGEIDNNIDAEQYDQLVARKDPALSRELSASEDIASIKRLENHGELFIVRGQNNQVDVLIVPVRGYGLWSTLYGFMALESDFNTVRGLGFYQHGETPGLGGEIDNPKWKALWPGKKLVDSNGKLTLAIVKNPNPDSQQYIHQIDAISGASLTSRGVHNLLEFWLGDSGYGNFLTKLRNKEVTL